jgi:LCP family protein required for cell wall assembly
MADDNATTHQTAVPTGPPMPPDPDSGAHIHDNKRKRWPIVLGVIGVVMVVLVGGGVAAGLWSLNQLSGNIDTVKVDTAAPPEPGEAVNILLMGSDSRLGKGNTGYGLDAGRGGERSDTTILLHIPADRTRALAVSIPRDTWVEQPGCATRGKSGVFDKFNNAFEQGGASCTTKLAQQITGVPIHHVVVVDFGGFKRVVDAMGGVEVCVNEAIRDADSDLNLRAGTSLIGGEKALAFVRARKTLGDGSDIGRIERQQVFLSAAIRQATDAGLLLNPVKLYQVLDTATRSLTVDEGLDELGEMKTLLDSLRAVDPADITFVTMPFLGRSDANVDIDRPKADEIWRAIRQSTPWPPPVSRGPDGNKLTVPPDQIWVQVVEASGKREQATKAARQLRRAGFHIVGISESGQTKNRTAVRFRTGSKDSARTLAYAVDAPLVRDPEAWSTTVVVGKNWSGVQPDIVVAKSKKTFSDPRTEATTADESICSQ